MKKYFFISILFHVLLFVSMAVLVNVLPERKISKTQITMVSLKSKFGDPKGKSENPPTQTLPPSQPEKPPVKATPIKEPTPIAKPNPPTQKPSEKKPSPPIKPKIPKKKPTKESGVKITKQKKPPPKKQKEKIPQINTQKTKSPEADKLAAALSGINQGLEDRQKQLETPNKPGLGSPNGSPNGSSGGSDHGSTNGSVTARDPGYASYQSLVRRKIMSKWVRTNVEPGTKLRSRVMVRINASGSVISKSLLKRSGNSSFDNSTLRAVESASPLPTPPAGIQQEALQEGFIVDFRS